MTLHLRISILLLVTISLFQYPSFSIAGENDIYFHPGATLREIAEKNNLRVRELKKALDIPANIRGRTRISKLGITRDQLRVAVTRIHEGRSPKNIFLAQLLFLLIIAFVISLLVRKKMSHQLKFLLLTGVILGIGFGMGKAFNPMVGLVKTFKGLFGLENNLQTYLYVLFLFSLLAIIGTKAVCGWACPYGALQEFLYKLPLFRQWKKSNKIPFYLSNTIRIAFFLFFLGALTFDLLGLKSRGRVIYHYFNPFNLFEWHFTSLSIIVYICITLGLSLFFYRPHCLFVCPFGLYSWFLERISIFQIRVNREKCTDCQACVKACPGLAMKGILTRSNMRPDCFSCGECLKACTFDAISYSQRIL